MLPGMRSRVLRGAQERKFKMQATEERPSEEAAGMVEAQQTGSMTGKALKITGARFPITGERSDLQIRRRGGWTERCRMDILEGRRERQVFNTDGEREMRQMRG